ncbi:MAG: sigma 54-interacting transcriptional regulator [Desulfovibrio sp.]|jgi:transcriptional regulator with PAS, ATPase and Fis domain|nr:sigma 54-interacting transcriptional regulator [Desulfovibrio sp.]
MPADTNDFILECVADNPFEGVFVIDVNGIVVFINSFFLNILNLRREDIIGAPIVSFIPTCRLIETVEQGYSTWGETLKINDHSFLVARLPLKKNNTVIGGMVKTIFPDLAVAKEIANKVFNKTQLSQVGEQNLYTYMNIVGETPSMLSVKKLARQASRTSSTLLITGESGTGKEIIAQAVHTRSVRRERPFISINCGAIPENLLESELFGYTDGAFTGAKKGGNPGKFELAQGGTILLDEIVDMPSFMQVKLLRVLQDREIWRIGATVPTKIEVRVMASTNADLKHLVQENKFRQDLYYRLNVLEIKMPPLRDRLDDLPMLVQTLIERINSRIGSNAQGVTEESMRLLRNYSWPGNVRELENLLEQAINWNRGPLVDVEKIPNKPWETSVLKSMNFRRRTSAPNITEESGSTPAFRESVQEKEKTLIVNALRESGGNKTKAAKLLNMQRSVLYKKLEKIQIA